MQKIKFLGFKIQILSNVSVVFNPFSTIEGGDQYFLLKFFQIMAREAKKIEGIKAVLANFDFSWMSSF